MELSNLIHLMRRAEAGGELTIAFFGGSITQGSLATAPDKCYAANVFRWFQKSFPQTEFHYVNGGIGGTSSLFGCARIREDLLMYHPDFVVVDFSVNDVDDDGRVQEYFQESYEAVIRRILLQDPDTAVVILNNVFYDTGISADSLHNAIGDHYGVPHVNIRESAFYQDIRAGRLRREEISPDGLHPNDRGHRLVADEIIRLLERTHCLSAGQGVGLAEKPKRQNGDSIAELVRTSDGRNNGSAAGTFLPAPFTRNRYESSVRHTILNTDPELQGFLTDSSEKKGHLDFWKNGWIGRRAGDAIVFHLTCSCLSAQYRKTAVHGSPTARLVLDGDEEHAVILDGNFRETWGDCLYLQRVLDEQNPEEHEIRIEIIRDGTEAEKPFYLLSLITA